MNSFLKCGDIQGKAAEKTPSEKCVYTTCRRVPVESSKVTLYPGKLDLDSQSGSIGIYRVPPFRQIEDWGVEVRSSSIRSLYWMPGQGSLVSGFECRVLKGG